ncbi:MAG: metal ABC transporter solute-binding protein, Zn/Mn family [Lachnospiraceae bacterium]|jgi:zinc transport system substrate-binding protein
MKKIILTAATVILALFVLAGCGSPSGRDDNFKVVTTVYPLYDWAINLTRGTGTDVEYLIDSGVDLHSFKPTASDLVAISECDVFIFIGGESDEWVSDALASIDSDVEIINLSEKLSDTMLTEETKEGMESDMEEGEELDEHIWLSPVMAKRACGAMSDAFSKADPENEAFYAEDLEEYLSDLDDLDNEYREAVRNAANRTQVFGDRFPFRYLFEEYGLDYYAAFSGCSAESEASFETIMFLAGKVDELGLKYIFQTENSDGTINRTISENTSGDQEILVLDSMQSASENGLERNSDYISVMKNNLEVLKKAL